jgi:hypothetical protein
VAASAIETENMAASHAGAVAAETHAEIGQSCQTPAIALHGKNQAYIAIRLSPASNERAEQIDQQHQFVRGRGQAWGRWSMWRASSGQVTCGAKLPVRQSSKCVGAVTKAG